MVYADVTSAGPGATHQLMGADVIGQVPLLNASGLVAGDQLALIWVHAYIVHWHVG